MKGICICDHSVNRHNFAGCTVASCFCLNYAGSNSSCSRCGSRRAELIGFTNRDGKVCVNAVQCSRRHRNRAMSEMLIARLEGRV